MEEAQHHKLKLKIGLTIKKYIDDHLEIHKKNIQNKEKDHPSLLYNAMILANTAGVRPATISAIINGDAYPGGKTLFLILEAFKISLSQFAARFEEISDKELEKYRLNVIEERNERRRRKK